MAELPHTIRRFDLSWWLLAALTAAMLLPFAGKAAHIDDPLFLWSARQIQTNQLDFYGFRVNWYGVGQPMYDVTKNPPLTSYFLALAAAIFGWSETGLHLVLLLPAIGAVLGTYHLAKLIGAPPLASALFLLCTPVFLVCATSLMCDVPMLCLWTWSLVAWISAMQKRRWTWYLAAAAGMALAMLTKYFAISLLPLTLVYTLMKRRRLTAEPGWLLIPAAVLAYYQYYTWTRYGRGLVSDAAAYVRYAQQASAGVRLLTSLCFAGGCLATAGLAMFFRGTWKRVAACAGAVLVLACLLALGGWSRYEGIDTSQYSSIIGHSAVFIGLGALLLMGTTVEAWRRRDPDTWLLFFWAAGTFLFAGLVNWSVNGRSVLPMAPAVGILAARRLGHVSLAAMAIFTIGGGLGLAAAWADTTQANANRLAAEAILKKPRGAAQRLWFEGHWGFQYYMQAGGAVPMEFDRITLEKGDLVAVPKYGSNVYPFPQHITTIVQTEEIPVCGWLAVLRPELSAGFHSDAFGQMPYAFGLVATERFDVHRMNRPYHTPPSK